MVQPWYFFGRVHFHNFHLAKLHSMMENWSYCSVLWYDSTIWSNSHQIPSSILHFQESENCFAASSRYTKAPVRHTRWTSWANRQCIIFVFTHPMRPVTVQSPRYRLAAQQRHHRQLLNVSSRPSAAYFTTIDPLVLWRCWFGNQQQQQF